MRSADWMFDVVAVSGPIRDIGQNVLQSAFCTEGGSNSSYCHVLFLIAFLEGTFIVNIMCLYRVLIIIIIMQ